MEQNQIEKLETYSSGQTNRYGEYICWTYHPTNDDFMEKINELVDAVNELREELKGREKNENLE